MFCCLYFVAGILVVPVQLIWKKCVKTTLNTAGADLYCYKCHKSLKSIKKDSILELINCFIFTISLFYLNS
jgi:hypothetical protein